MMRQSFLLPGREAPCYHVKQQGIHYDTFNGTHGLTLGSHQPQGAQRASHPQSLLYGLRLPLLVLLC